MFHFAKALLDTASALSAALTPATPRFQLAIHWTWKVVARPECGKRQAFGTSIRMGEDAPGQGLRTSAA